MPAEDAINIGLSDDGQAALQRLKDAGYFREMVEGYRFAVALAMAHGLIADEETKFRTNWNTGSVDPDTSIRGLIVEFFPEVADRPYAFAQRLAEAGVRELSSLEQAGQLEFRWILSPVNPTDLDVSTGGSPRDPLHR